MSRRHLTRIWALMAALVPALAGEGLADPIYTVVDLGEVNAARLNAAGQVAWTAYDPAGGGLSRAYLYSGYGPDAGRVAPIPVAQTLYSGILGINGSGQVIGQSSDGGSTSGTFLYDGGVARDLGTLGGRYTLASGINAGGQVVGWSQTADGAEHAFLYSGGRMHDLGTLGGPGSRASALNDRGQVVGTAVRDDGEGHAFLYSDGRMHDLGTLGGRSSYASGINALGQVVGVSRTADGSNHIFLYSGGRMHDLGTPGGDGPSLFPEPRVINAAGQVAGTFFDNIPPSGRAFLHSEGRYREFSFGGSINRVTALNAQGQVVGTSQLADGPVHAFVFRDGEVFDLNDLIPPDTGWTLSEATDLNDAGQILVTGLRNGSAFGPVHTFLLTPAGLPTPAAPVPEPTALALLGLVAAAAGARLGIRQLRDRG